MNETVCGCIRVSGLPTRLYNNAGVQNVLAETADSPRDDYDRIMGINPARRLELYEVRAAADARGKVKWRRSLVARFLGLAGLIGGPRRGTYHAAKHELASDSPMAAPRRNTRRVALASMLFARA